jgi:hypothetical protein
MSIRLRLFLPLALVACTTGLPPAAEDGLEHADVFEVLALDPVPSEEVPANAFHGHTVLGRATVTDAALRTRIVRTIERGAGHGTRSKCFNPRHGVHTMHGSKMVDLMICYECGEIDVYDGTESQLSTSDVGAEVETLFKEAGVHVTRSKP